MTLEGSPTLDAMHRSAARSFSASRRTSPASACATRPPDDRSGFDIDLATWIAAELGFATDKIEFVTIPSQSREQALTNGDADLIIGMYTISEKRKELVGFAGPYMTNGQSILVRADNTDIKGEADLAGHKVCSITGSTPIQYIKDEPPGRRDRSSSTTWPSASTRSLNGQVDAVTTDEALLIGYITLDPGRAQGRRKAVHHTRASASA